MIANEDSMAVNSTTKELVSDCLERIEKGDACAPMDLASVFMSHAESKDIDMHLAVVEALALLSRKQGCQDADQFLKEQWFGMKEGLRGRWERAGFV
jgi:hypothetical protein